MNDLHWWQRGVIYEIIPQSFKDSNGDGMGDLPGLISKLDYLTWLGIDVIWLGPIYHSPMVDFGYDVSDYERVNPLFGTLQDFDRLLAEAHARNLKVILDFVANHTSDQHEWFKASRSSRDNPKRDWFLWRDPGLGDGPPNNWMSVFGGSAWQFDGTTGQYFYHSFTESEVDLNWRNPEVVEAMLDVMRFWLARGVDGFRIDAAWYLIKDSKWRDNPREPAYEEKTWRIHERQAPVFSQDQPECHDILKRMRRVADEYGDRLLVGEFYLPIDNLLTYYGGRANDEVHLPNNFQLVILPWEADHIAKMVSHYEGKLPAGAWPNYVIGNHDQPRVATRLGLEQARIAAMLLLTLRGTPFLYYGDEIGMMDGPESEEVYDPQVRDFPYGGGNRTPYRSPMQWDESDGAGFSTGTPWLPLTPTHRKWNVERQKREPDSILMLYRRLLQLRRQEPALYGGDYIPLLPQDTVLPFLREANGTRFLILLNLGEGTVIYRTSRLNIQGEVAVCTRVSREGERVKDFVELNSHDGLVIRLDP